MPAYPQTETLPRRADGGIAVPLNLTMAISEYDHVRDLATGRIVPEGIALSVDYLPLEEIFARFPRSQPWDVAEMSMGMYCAMRARGDQSVTAIPVFPSRVFRQSSVYVRTGGPVRQPEDLRGKRVGAPNWFQTAMIYVRGWLSDDIGLDLRQISWVQAGVDRPTSATAALPDLPAGFSLTHVADRSLDGMLRSGAIDALISSHAPSSLQEGKTGIEPLLRDSAEYERQYFLRTGVFPIMHVIGLRNATFERDRWIARSLLEAFEAAKTRSRARLGDINQSLFPVPWLPHHVARLKVEMFPESEYWPYGVAPNRHTLEVFLRYCHEQGVCSRQLVPADLFPRELQ